MKLEAILLERRMADLYHATKINYFKDQLEHDYITASTIHRWWKNGLRHERSNGDGSYNHGKASDKNSKWKDHVWIKGISLTRDFNFAKRWGPIVYTLDQTALDARYKFLPMKWQSPKVKRFENEEFLWMHTSKISGDGPEPIQYADDGQVKLTNLHRYLKKITLVNKYVTKNDSFYQDTKDRCEAYCKKWNLEFEEV